MKKFFTKIALRFLLRRMGPESFPTSGSDLQKINYVYVWLNSKGSESDEKKKCIAISLTDSRLSCIEYESNNLKSETTLKIDQIGSREVKVIHYYHNQTTTYLTIIGAWLSIAVKIHVLRNIRQGFYNRNLKFSTERIDFLRKVIDFGKHSTPVDRISVQELAVSMYGPRIEDSVRYYDAIIYISWMIYSFENELEVSSASGNRITDFSIKPRAYQTLFEYEDELKRHRSMRRIFIVQAIAAAILVILAIWQALGKAILEWVK